MPAMSLDVIEQVKPEVAAFVRAQAEANVSMERIAKELFARFDIDISRSAVERWLKGQVAE